MAPLFLNAVFWETYRGFGLPWIWIALGVAARVWSAQAVCLGAGLGAAYIYGFLIEYQTAQPNIAVCLGVTVAGLLAARQLRLRRVH